MKRVHLDVNDAGGWRRVMSFDVSDPMQGQIVLQAAHELLRWSENPRLRARIIIPCDTAPLMTWSLQHGWREWVHPADKAQGVLA